MNVGLVLARDYYAAATAERGKVTKIAAKRDRRDVEAKVTDSVSLVAGQIGGGVSSVRVVTDAVRSAIEAPRQLGKVVLLRLSSPEGRDSPPLVNDAVARHVLTTMVLSGGRGFDGRTVAPIDEDEIVSAYRTHRGGGVSFVLSSPFSMLYPQQESAARDVLVRAGAKNVWTSSDLSSIPSVLDRESTAVLSAAASAVIARIERKVAVAFSRRKKAPRIYFGQNDGGVASAAYARMYPLGTYWSVEGNSISGACALSGERRLVVAGGDRSRVWLGGSAGGLPIMRQIAYIRGTLVHVSSPMIAELTQSTPEPLRLSLHSMISDMVGSQRAVSVGPGRLSGLLATAERVEGSEAACAAGVALGVIRLDSSLVRPKGYEESRARAEIRELAQGRLKLMGARGSTVKLSGVRMEPGYNLPEGSFRLSVQGTAKVR